MTSEGGRAGVMGRHRGLVSRATRALLVNFKTRTGAEGLVLRVGRALLVLGEGLLADVGEVEDLAIPALLRRYLQGRTRRRGRESALRA